jgi:hypothetical protein
MVYCTKCGTQNADDARVCVKCGAALVSGQQEQPYWGHRHYYREHQHYHQHHGSGFGALLGGVIITVVGLLFLVSEVYGIQLTWTYFWAAILVIIGIWLVSRAVWWRRRQ